MQSKLGFVKAGLLAITAGAAIGIAGFGSSTSAFAKDNRPDPMKVCLYNGMIYLPGEVIKIDDGFDERSFLCNSNGEWYEVTYLDSANTNVSRNLTSRH